jgi:hypothetical protein
MPGPDVWGPHGWKFIHYITLGYPVIPTKEDKDNYYKFFHALRYVIPCSICGNHFKENLEKTPLDDDALSTRMKLVEWGIKMHNHVNKLHGKKEYTFEEGLSLLLQNKEECSIEIEKKKNDDDDDDEVESFENKDSRYIQYIVTISILVNIILIMYILFKSYKK